MDFNSNISVLSELMYSVRGWQQQSALGQRCQRRDATEDRPKGECRVMTVAQQSDKIMAIWEAHSEVSKCLPQLARGVSDAIDLIYSSLSAGGQLLIAGNGGSAADAQHIAAELTGRFLLDRQPLRAIALHANTSALTAVANDYGYENVFARELAAHARNDDVLLAISTSGNSPSILRAIDVARERGVVTIGLTGESGGQMRTKCDLCLCIPSASTARVQEMHITIGHAICELLEERLAITVESGDKRINDT
jgi:D-sedoheptulose 7-phosphate isomerase